MVFVMVSSHPLGDLFEHDLGGTAADGLDTGIARHAFHGCFPHIAHTAMELDTVVKHAVYQLATIGLDHRYFFDAIAARGI